MAIEDVRGLIEQLTSAHEDLLGLSKKKSELIKADKIKEFQKLLMQERKQVQTINQLETKRIQAVEQLFQEWDVPNEEKTVTILLEHLEEGPEKQQLEAAVAALIDQIVAIRQAEQLNKDLIEQSLQFVQLSLEMMQPNMQQMNYNQKSTSKSPTTTSVFDSKA